AGGVAAARAALEAGDLLRALALGDRVERGARPLAQVRLVGGVAVGVELDVALDGVVLERAPERPRAVHLDLAPGDLGGDRREPALVDDAVVLVGDPPHADR